MELKEILLCGGVLLGLWFVVKVLQGVAQKGNSKEEIEQRYQEQMAEIREARRD